MLAGRKFLIVGAGFYGSVWAQQLAQAGEKVLVIDKRPHLGGNCYTYQEKQTGIEVHQYGSHIFHTQDKKVWDYICQFTQFNQYRHRVFTQSQGRAFSMPINLDTINSFYQKNFSPQEAQAFIAQEVAKCQNAAPKNLEEKALSQIGRPLYEAFIKGYTEKQWGQRADQLPESIINRLPVRFNYNAFYFDDVYQGIPTQGYTAIFDKMLSSPNIEIKLGVDFQKIRQEIPAETWIIYSGPLDAFFDYKLGELSWRTLDFEQEVVPVKDFQGNSVINYAESSVPYTRIHEFRHYHPEMTYDENRSVIMREFSRHAKRADVPYYPVNTIQDKALLEKYLLKCKEHPKVIFGGRLGSYKYFDMHQVIGQALAHVQRWKEQQKNT